MNAIVNVGPGRVTWKDWPRPEPGPGQARIRTAACGICATDLEMIAGWSRTSFPVVPGHEWSGVVDSVGPAVDAALMGKPCVAENVLSDGGEVGFEHPGGYGEYLVTEAANLHPLPQDFSLSTAALIEPLAVCVRALRRMRLEDCRSALIFGDGPIGLLMLLLLKTTRLDRIALVGGRPARLDLAREFGASAVFNYHEAQSDLARAAAGLPGAPFPNIIEASGSAQAVQASLDVAPRQGKIILLGDYGASCAGFPWNHALHQELELIGSCASAGAWPEAVRLAATGAVPLARLISRRLPASSYAEAIDLAQNSRDLVKVVMEWTVGA